MQALRGVSPISPNRRIARRRADHGKGAQRHDDRNGLPSCQARPDPWPGAAVASAPEFAYSNVIKAAIEHAQRCSATF
jgi:hypothetical protein